MESLFWNVWYYLQVTYTGEHSREPEEEEMYSAENFRRIARSLSGTVISNREETLVSSHSFVSRMMHSFPKSHHLCVRLLFSLSAFSS